MYMLVPTLILSNQKTYGTLVPSLRLKVLYAITSIVQFESEDVHATMLITRFASSAKLHVCHTSSEW